MLEHGGKLREAAAHYGRPLEQWLDLSTGINPRGYTVPALAADAWHRLPEDMPALAAAAQACYRAPLMLPVAGTQAAIQALPRLRPYANVVVASPSYAEHAHAWRRAGHAVREVAYAQLEAGIDQADVVVVCNPNNPTGETVAPEVLLDWHARLSTRGGWLVIDEAFADMLPQHSVAQATHRRGLIVLRSVGKFFGLAGLRLGFVAAEPALLSRLADHLGPWTISTAAQRIGHAALSDTDWQRDTRGRLLRDGERLRQLLAAHGIASTGTALFQWWPEQAAEALREHMAGHAIWVRLFPRAARGMRLGLPGDESGWQRLAHALGAWKEAQ